ncbi:MAG: hypothetical protein JSU66_03540 [Deltaproteobacteria bacterium]|nr:MAG: hypothetical protein JSU66_03540 [Deltaproteobacteria bacterium]
MSRCLARRPRAIALAAALSAVAVSTAPLAEEPVREDSGPAAPATAPAPRVGLDRLLKLPESMDYRVERHGGSTRNEWQERFRSARAEVASAREALEASQAKLEDVASDSGTWKLAPPGVPAGATDSPLDYQLRQDMKRQRDELAHAEQRLQDLSIEANLAGVPEDWRQ